jgi:hypothetical protein
MLRENINLQNFGRFVLEVLESQQDWSAATLDEIAEFAQRLGLARSDGRGMFKRLPGEQREATSQAPENSKR